jgi:hypothetical protein
MDGEEFYCDVVVNNKVNKQQRKTIDFFKIHYKDSRITYKISTKEPFLGW